MISRHSLEESLTMTGFRFCQIQAHVMSCHVTALSDVRMSVSKSQTVKIDNRQKDSNFFWQTILLKCAKNGQFIMSITQKGYKRVEMDLSVDETVVYIEALASPRCWLLKKAPEFFSLQNKWIFAISPACPILF